MRFQKSVHRNDSPSIHGMSFNAMAAIDDGMLMERDLKAEIKKVYNYRLTLAEVRKYVCTEWHHVEFGGRVVEMHFGRMPEDQDHWEIILWDIEDDRKRRIF